MKKKILIAAFVAIVGYLVYRWTQKQSPVSNDAGTPVIGPATLSSGAYGSVAKALPVALNIQSLGGDSATG